MELSKELKEKLIHREDAKDMKFGDIITIVSPSNNNIRTFIKNHDIYLYSDAYIAGNNIDEWYVLLLPMKSIGDSKRMYAFKGKLTHKEITQVQIHLLEKMLENKRKQLL